MIRGAEGALLKKAAGEGATVIELTDSELSQRKALVPDAQKAILDEMGGAAAAVETGYMKERLVQSNTARVKAIEAGEQMVIGVNAYTETEASPLLARRE